MPPVVAVAIVVMGLLGLAVWRSLVIAGPDEWLLCIRNGALVRAGVGISLWRRPGDVVARFTSTMQRVGFEVDALSAERLRVSIHGFTLWSVSAAPGAPFLAFRKLGLANLDAPPRDLASTRHLLTAPQHRAFRQLLAAAVQRLASTKPLEELLSHQDSFVAELSSRLASLEEELGILVDRTEILHVRPADGNLLQQMSAAVEGRLREVASAARLETAERVRLGEIESETRMAQEQARARALEFEREKALRLARIAIDREVALREGEVGHEQELAREARATEVARASMERDELHLAARLDRTRRVAAARRDAIATVASAQEGKSQMLRDHELAMAVAQKVSDALKGLPLHEARWITVGPDSPLGSLASLIGAARELTAGRSTKAD